MVNSIGYIAACITLLSWTIGTFAFTRASKENNPASVNRVRLLYAVVFLSFLVVISLQINPIELFTQLSLEQYFWFGLSGFIGLTLGDYLAFTAYKILGGRRTSLFSCFSPGAALLAAYFLIGENVNFIGIIGMAVSISGILLLILSRKEQTHVANEGSSSFWKGIIYAALGAICQGVGLVLAKKGFFHSVENFNPIYATWIRMLVATIFVYLIGAFKINLWVEFKTITFDATKIKPVLIGTLFGPIIGVSFSMLAAANLEASVVQTLFSLLPVFVLFGAVIILKEKVPMKSYLAVLVSIIGVIILVWRNDF
jgi:drug/metabolite transporter (DMT)-like permease